jgi:hypothetical protein
MSSNNHVSSVSLLLSEIWWVHCGADRPFTESEVQFLRYIRQWGKKVVFLVNKLDILASEDEVAEVQRFVADNARAVLGVDSARVLPIAARSALAAKLDLLGSRGAHFSFLPLALSFSLCPLRALILPTSCCVSFPLSIVERAVSVRGFLLLLLLVLVQLY